MKSKLFLKIGLVAMAAITATTSALADDIRANVNNEPVNFTDVQPMMVSGHVMVPVRGVFEMMHANLEWDEYSQTVTAQHGSDTIRMPINSTQATINGDPIQMDYPAITRGGRALVPIRFLSEAMGARVRWSENSQSVDIYTSTPVQQAQSELQNHRTYPASYRQRERTYRMVVIDSGTVVPFRLRNSLSSLSPNGTRFTAILDERQGDYQGLPSGTILDGHVSVSRSRSQRSPGVLGLDFDDLRLPDGQSIPVRGSLIGLGDDNVVNQNGRMRARPGAKNDNLKYVGYGAGGGALISVLTKGNLVTDTVIGSALGYLFGTTQNNSQESRNVQLDAGTNFGVRLDQGLTFRVYSPRNR